MEWVTNVWGRHTIRSADKLLLCDNLDAQVDKEFQNKLSNDYNTTVYWGPANLTEDWQPVDAGYGRCVKEEYGKMQENWLELNQDPVTGGPKKVTTSERRIMVTHWVASAVEKVNSLKYAADDQRTFVWRLFEKTGCLITLTGHLLQLYMMKLIVTL